MAKKKSAPKKKAGSRKKPSSKKKQLAKKKSSARKKPARRKKSIARGRQQTTFPAAITTFPDSASGGQAGDTQGLSRQAEYDSESVGELAEEGQYFEAEAVSGVEDAKDPDQGEVRTSEVPEDDVPLEYTDRDDQT